MREPKHRVGLAVAQRAEQVGQAFRRVLAVAVEQRDEIEAVLDRVVVADLLVAAVALVDRIEEDRERERRELPSEATSWPRSNVRSVEASSMTSTSTSYSSAIDAGTRSRTVWMVFSAL